MGKVKVDLVPGDHVRAGKVPEGRVILTIQTRRIGVVLEQKPGEATLIDFGENPRHPFSLHPQVMLEIAE